MRKIILTDPNRFQDAAQNDLERLCGTVEVGTEGVVTVISGYPDPVREKDSPELRSNWEQVGVWAEVDA